MKINYADEFREDLKEFREMTEKFYNKEITVAQYKGFSGGFGSYAQRGGEASMLRLRLCGGRIDKNYLDFIVNSIEKYQISLAHITTCQSIQLHNLEASTVCSLMEEAWDQGIITRGGGGDFPRNVMMTPLTGVIKEESFDMTPYANAAADYMLGFIKTVKLPRKLKVCFSSTPDNFPHATFRDLGFVATAEGKFDVYSAGGLGINPKMGVCVAKGVEPNQILYHIKAMINTFTAYGNYENRAKARTRFMQDVLGAEGYIKAYNEKLNEVLNSEEDLTLTIEESLITKTGSTAAPKDRRIIEQKQPGLYAVSYHPFGGNPTAAKLAELRDAMKDMEDVEIRLTPDEGMYIINCTGEEAARILAITDDGANTTFETSVACVGNRICQVGARDSQELLKLCLDAVRPHNFADGILPQIHISGCPSSCAAHQTGRIGFRGAAKQTAEGPKAAFALFENGHDRQGEERFGNEIGAMLLEDIPVFLVELGQTITDANSTFEEWFTNNHDEFLALAKKYI